MKNILLIFLLLASFVVFAQTELELPYSVKVVTDQSLDWKYGPWADAADAISNVPESIRKDGLTVFLQDSQSEYWWLGTDLTDGGLIPKTSASSFATITGSPYDNTDLATELGLKLNKNIYYGHSWKQYVKVATTANGTLSTAFEQGDVVDGIFLGNGDRILLKNQSTASQNGIHTVNVSGAPTRPDDYPTGGLGDGVVVYVSQGTVNANRAYKMTSPNVTIGTTSQVWAQMGDVAGPSSSTDNLVATWDGTTGKLLKNTTTPNISAATGVQLTLTAATTTGTGTSSGVSVVANSLTTGRAVDISSSSITSGNLMRLTSTSTAINDGAGGSLLNINSSGANSTSNKDAVGFISVVTNTGTGSINYAGNLTSIGAGTNYGVLTEASGSNATNYGAYVKSLGTGTSTNTAGTFDASGGTNNHAIKIENGDFVLGAGGAGISGQVFTSQGANALPTWTTPSGGGGLTTVSNGLTATGSNAKLGGALINNTVIDGAFNLYLGQSGTELADFEVWSNDDIDLRAQDDIQIISQSIVSVDANAVTVDVVDSLKVEIAGDPGSPGEALVSDGDGKVVWGTPSASTSLSAITAATATNTINNAGHIQDWQWNSLAGATAFTISSSSTAAASNLNKLFRVDQTGVNATASQVTYAASFNNLKTGTGSFNVAMEVEASGGAAGNYAMYVRGGNINMPDGQAIGWADGFENKGISMTSNVLRLSAFNALTFYNWDGAAYSERMRLTATDGNLVIGTTTAGARLHSMGAGTTTAYNILTENSSGTDRFAVEDNGEVLFSGGGGSSGQVLTSAGANAPPTWAAPAIPGAWSLATGGTLTGNQAIDGDYNLNIGLVTPVNQFILFSDNSIALTADTNIGFTGGTDINFTTSGGNINLSTTGNVTSDSKVVFASTITAGGTTGNQTINKPSGTVNIAAAGTTVTVTNSFCTTSSIVMAVIRTNDSTCYLKNVVPSAGSFVINLGAAATAEVSIGFIVYN